MMQSKMAFPVKDPHLIVVALQPMQIQTHHTLTTSLVEEQQIRIHLTSSLPSGGQSESMSKSVIIVTFNPIHLSLSLEHLDYLSCKCTVHLTDTSCALRPLSRAVKCNQDRCTVELTVLGRTATHIDQPCSAMSSQHGANILG